MEKSSTFISVDASARGNPGPTEYRLVTHDGAVVYASDVFKGTNNIGEFLALVHALAYAVKNDMTVIVYSDSQTAISWVRKKCHNTTLIRDVETEHAWVLLERADAWLKSNRHPKVTIVKWPTKKWGEIPADYGRK